MVHLQRGALGIESHLLVELLFRRRKTPDKILRFRQVQFILREFRARSGLFLEKSCERVVILLQPVAVGDGVREISVDASCIARSAARAGGAQVILGAQAVGVGLRELRNGIFHVQFQEQLALLHRAAFHRRDLRHKRGQFRPDHRRGDRLNLAVARNRGHQIFALRHDGRNFGRRLPPAQTIETVRGRSGQNQKQQDAVSQSSIHEDLLSMQIDSPLSSTTENTIGPSGSSARFQAQEVGAAIAIKNGASVLLRCSAARLCQPALSG